MGSKSAPAAGDQPVLEVVRDENGRPELVDFLTTKESAKLLGLDPTTLKHWRHLRTGPRYYRIGRIVRYRVEDLLSWASNQAVEPSK